MQSGELIKRLTDIYGNSIAVMIDKKNKIQVVCASSERKMRSLSFESFDENMNGTSHLSFFDDEHLKNRLYLAMVTTNHSCFGKGLATNANCFAEFLLKNTNYNYIYGIFSPGQYENRNIKTFSQKDLDLIARKFYSKIGYYIISENDYLKNPEMYPYLSIEDFLDGDYLFKIVAKNFEKEKVDCGFKTISGIHVKNNVPEKVMEEIDCMQM